MKDRGSKRGTVYWSTQPRESGDPELACAKTNGGGGGRITGCAGGREAAQMAHALHLHLEPAVRGSIGLAIRGLHRMSKGRHFDR